MQKDSRIGEILISSRKIQSGIRKTAKWLNQVYANKKPVIIGILKGCIPFIGRIIPFLNFDHELDFMSVSSFHGGTQASSQLSVNLDISTNITGRDVLILEDIIDTARTLSLVIDLLKQRNPASIKLVTLLDKKEGRKVKLDSDFSCFDIPNKFIVGFGLDYMEIMRNYDFIGCLKPEYINNKSITNSKREKHV